MVLSGPEKVLTFSKPNNITDPPAMWQRQKQANGMGITPGTQGQRTTPWALGFLFLGVGFSHSHNSAALEAEMLL